MEADLYSTSTKFSLNWLSESTASYIKLITNPNVLAPNAAFQLCSTATHILIGGCPRQSLRATEFPGASQIFS